MLNRCPRRWRSPLPPSGPFLRRALAIVLALLAGVQAAGRTLPLTAVSLHVEGLAVTDRLELFFVRGDRPDRTAVVPRVVAGGPGPRRITFRHRLRNVTSRLRLDPGSGPPAGLSRLAVARMTLDSCVLWWCLPVLDLDLEAVAAAARFPHNVALAYRDGRLAVRATGPDPYFSLPLDLPRLRAAMAPAPALAVRLLWAALGLLAAFLVWHGDRLGAGLRRLGAALARLPASAAPARAPAGAWAWAGTGLLLAWVGLRFAPDLAAPVLRVEDGSYYYHQFGALGRGLSDIWMYHNRYTTPITHLVAWAAARAGAGWTPAVYTGFAVVLAVLAAANLNFAGLWRDRWLRLAAPTLLGAVGLGHEYFWLTLTEQVYVGVVLLLCIFLWPPPRGRVAWPAWTLGGAALAWFGPYSAVAVPAAGVAMALYRGRRARITWAAVALSALAYYGTVEPGTTAAAAVSWSQRWLDYQQVLFEQVLLLGLGGPARTWKVLAVLVLLAAVCRPLRRDREALRRAAILWTIVLAALAPYFFSVKYMPGHHWPVHVVISQFFWLVFLLLAADRWIQAARRRFDPAHGA